MNETVPTTDSFPITFFFEKKEEKNTQLQIEYCHCIERHSQ